MDLYLLISSFPLTQVFLMTASASIVLGIRVILDLTPNYRGQNPWFLPDEITSVATKVEVSADGRWEPDAGAVLVLSQQPCKPCPASAEGPLAAWSQAGTLLPRQKDKPAVYPFDACSFSFLSTRFSCFLDSDGDSARKEFLRCQSGFDFSSFWERKPILCGSPVLSGFLVLVGCVLEWSPVCTGVFLYVWDNAKRFIYVF